jgi:hypothetical protein
VTECYKTLARAYCGEWIFSCAHFLFVGKIFLRLHYEDERFGRVKMTKIQNANHSLTSVFNPVWKTLARFLVSNCEECGQRRLISVFDVYSAHRTFFCKSCLLTATALMPLIRLLFFSLRVDDSTIKKLLNDPLIGKCMLSVVKGIANFGIRYPQPAGAR